MNTKRTLLSIAAVTILVFSNFAFVDVNKTTKTHAISNLEVVELANGQVTVEFEKLKNVKVQIDVFNTLGELIYSETVTKDTEISKQFDMSKLPAGNYFYIVSNDSYSVSKTLQKK